MELPEIRSATRAFRIRFNSFSDHDFDGLFRFIHNRHADRSLRHVRRPFLFAVSGYGLFVVDEWSELLRFESSR